jgi:hypothetical protein
MNSVIDNSLVGLALLVSAGYALLSLGPRSLRRRLLAVLSRATALLGLRRTAERLAVASGGKARLTRRAGGLFGITKNLSIQRIW